MGGTTTPRMDPKRGTEVEYRTGTIAKDDATGLSNAINLVSRKLLGFYVPTMDSAALSFQVSRTGIAGTFKDLYDSGSSEVSIGAGTHDKAYQAPVALLGWPFIKIRSGVTGAAVTQTTAAVDIILAITD